MCVTCKIRTRDAHMCVCVGGRHNLRHILNRTRWIMQSLWMHDDRNVPATRSVASLMEHATFPMRRGKCCFPGSCYRSLHREKSPMYVVIGGIYLEMRKNSDNIPSLPHRCPTDAFLTNWEASFPSGKIFGCKWFCNWWPKIRAFSQIEL